MYLESHKNRDNIHLLVHRFPWLLLVGSDNYSSLLLEIEIMYKDFPILRERNLTLKRTFLRKLTMEESKVGVFSSASSHGNDNFII